MGRVLDMAGAATKLDENDRERRVTETARAGLRAPRGLDHGRKTNAGLFRG
jgi:hypothetical protein